METEILATIDDPDLGRLDLVRERFKAQSGGDSDWQDLSFIK